MELELEKCSHALLHSKRNALLAAVQGQDRRNGENENGVAPSNEDKNDALSGDWDKEKANISYRSCIGTISPYFLLQQPPAMFGLGAWNSIRF